jgi:hypothetical protein
MLRSTEIESILAAINELLLTRLKRDRSEADNQETTAIVREITQIRDKMLADPSYNPVERTHTIEKLLQRATSTI